MLKIIYYYTQLDNEIVVDDYPKDNDTFTLRNIEEYDDFLITNELLTLYNVKFKGNLV